MTKDAWLASAWQRCGWADAVCRSRFGKGGVIQGLVRVNIKFQHVYMGATAGFKTSHHLRAHS